MYSQNNEEQIILNYFAGKPSASFWDIGAYDGRTFSNTLALLELGWSGIAVEGSPQNFVNLLENTKQHTDRLEYVLGVITIDHDGLTHWYDTGGDAISTPSSQHKEIWEKSGHVFKKMSAAMFCWRNLWRIDDQPEFINVDVEGGSAVLAIDMFKGGMRPDLWCIEHDGKADHIASLFKRSGYRELLRNHENIILNL